MMPMLAQEQLQSLPDHFWKNFCIAILVLIGAAGVLVLIWTSLRKPAPTRVDDDPAIKVRKVNPRYNHEAIDARFGRIETRLDGHDSEIDAAWAEMKAMQEKANHINTGIAVSLAKIETHLRIDQPTTIFPSKPS